MTNYIKLANRIKDEIRKNTPNIDEEKNIEAVFMHLSEIILENAFLKEVNKYKEYSNGKEIIMSIYPYLYENEMSTSYPISDELRREISKTINGELIIDAIGKLYEDYVPIDKKKDIGQFYTRSNNLIDKILDNLDYKGNEMINKKVIDPAAGSGMLLISAISRLKNHMLSKGYSPFEILQKITSNFYAIDLDPFAAYLAEINIFVQTMELAVDAFINQENFKMNRFNILIRDFTLVPENDISFFETTNNLKNGYDELDLIKLKIGKFSSGFDIVLSNPPYITMYGRRSRNMNEEKRNYYNSNYDFVQKKNGNNKFNSIMFFIEQSIKMICEKQKIAFIIDMSFFETAFKDLRKYILDTCIINKIVVNLKEFDSVASGQLVLFLEKENDKETRHSNSIKWLEGFDSDSLKIKQLEWYRPEDEYKYFKPLLKEENDILNKVEKFPTLKRHFPNKQLRTCCALTGRTEDFMAKKSDFENDENDLIFPYLEGSKGLKHKFGKLTNNKFLNYDYDLQIKISDEFKEELTKLGVKNKKRVTLGDRDCYLSPKIFIRQSAKILIATYTEDKFAANNSLYILTKKDDSDENKRFLKYVCALLNSELLTFYAQKKRIIRMGKGKTPQIKISDLHNLRLNIDKAIYDEVIDLVDQIQNEESKENKYMIEKLNCLINDSYGITENEVKYLKDEIKKAVE